jgi:hypothetical protein
LENGLVDKKKIFNVEKKGEGKGGLGLDIEGNYEEKMKCKENSDG